MTRGARDAGVIPLTPAGAASPSGRWIGLVWGMRARWASAVLIALSVPVPGQEGGPVYAPALPDGVGSVAGWEIITGDFETPDAKGARTG